MIPIARSLIARLARAAGHKRYFDPTRRANEESDREAIRRRIELTVSCKDCDDIPKVPNAGEIIELDGHRVQVMHNGIVLAAGAYHGDWMCEIIRRLRGHHEPQEEKVFNEVLKKLPSDATMIEAGSYWAYYSLWFRQGYPGRKNFLIEPNPKKLDVGITNFALNRQQATFDAFYIGIPTTENAPFVDWDGTVIDVSPITIDAYMDLRSIRHVDILHADIQGAEYDLLIGAARALGARRISYLFLSIHDDNYERCLDTLRSYGYSIVAAHSIDESFSADGLIVAASPVAPAITSAEITRRSLASQVR